MLPRAFALLVVAVLLAGCAGSSRQTTDDGRARSGTSYFQHVTSCNGPGTCGTPFEAAFDVPREADRLALQLVVSSGATGAVRVDIKEPDGTTVYSKTLTPGSSQAVVESTTLDAERGRWTYGETYVSFTGTLSITVREA